MKNTARLVVMDSVWGHMGKLDVPACLIPLPFTTIVIQPEEDPTNKIPISW
jgi:hypothetical protein